MLALVNIGLPVVAALVSLRLYGSVWPAYIVNAIYVFLVGIWSIVNGNWVDAGFYFLGGLISLLFAFLFWLDDRKNKRKKKLLHTLGYKAKAAMKKLLANIPQGGRNPGFSPA